jgi:hypothetical protein
MNADKKDTGELTTDQFTDIDTVKIESTNKSIQPTWNVGRWTYYGSVRWLMTDTDKLTNRSVHSVIEKDEPTTDQFNLYSSKIQPYKQIRSIFTEG